MSSPKQILISLFKTSLIPASITISCFESVELLFRYK